MHYSLTIKGKPGYGGSFVFENPYRFKKPYITNMKVKVDPITSTIWNCDNTNIVRNRNGEVVYIPQGYHSLGEIMALINEMTYTGVSVITNPDCFGTTWIQSSCEVYFNSAPDVKEILGLEKNIYPAGGCHGENIIDITRNRQTIQVFSTIVKSADIKIANQYNNLLTTLIVEDPEQPFIHTVSEVNIPIVNTWDRLYFSFRDMDGKEVVMDADVEFQLLIEDTDEIGELEDCSQFTMAEVVNKSKKEVVLDNPLSFTGCYISGVSLYTDFQLKNVKSKQIVNIDGIEIEIDEGVYGIEEIIALLNCSDALFELIYDSGNAFRVSASYFYTIDFSKAPDIQHILGFDTPIISRDFNQGVAYQINDSNDTLSLKIEGVDTDIKFPHGYYDYPTFLKLLENVLIEYADLFSMYVVKVYQNVPVYSINTEKTISINKQKTTLQYYKWMEWLKYSYPQNNATLGVSTKFTLTENVDVYIDIKDVSTGAITENYTSGVFSAGEYQLTDIVNKVLEIINKNGTIYFIRDNTIIARNNNEPNIRLRTSRPIGLTPRNEFVRTLTPKANRQLFGMIDTEEDYHHSIIMNTNLYARCIPDVNKSVTQTFYFSEREVSLQYNTGGGSTNKTTSFRFSGMYSMKSIVERIITEVNNHSKANGGSDVLNYFEKNGMSCWQTMDTASMTFKILSADFLPIFGFYQSGQLSTGEEYTGGNLFFSGSINHDNCYYRETKICSPFVVGITIFNKSDNSVLCPEYRITIPVGSYNAFDLNEMIMYAACKNCVDITGIYPQASNQFEATIGETNNSVYTTTLKTDYYMKINCAYPGKIITTGNNLSSVTVGPFKREFFVKFDGVLNSHSINNHFKDLLTNAGLLKEWIVEKKNYYNRIIAKMTEKCSITTVNANNEEWMLVNATNGYTTCRGNSLDQIRIWSQNRYSGQIVNAGRTVDVNINDQTYTFDLLPEWITQDDMVTAMNENFLAQDIPLQWIATDVGYDMIYTGGYPLSGTLFTENTNLWNHFPSIITTPIKATWAYADNRLVSNLASEYSDYPVMIDNGLSQIKLYCNIVKSKTEPLLTIIPLQDLYKNYYFRNKMMIPCSDRLDKITYEFRDENGELLNFNGNIYLLITFRTY